MRPIEGELWARPQNLWGGGGFGQRVKDIMLDGVQVHKLWQNVHINWLF